MRYHPPPRRWSAAQGTVPAHAAVAEEFRMVKRHLLRRLRDGAGERRNLIAVTSAMPGEGKSFCALHLALSMAMERDTTVLLVDAHTAHPSLPAMLGLPGGPGMLDLLVDDHLNAADVIIRTGIGGLSVLPAGQSSLHAAELLSSRDMERLLAELASRYADRVIIFDTAPLLPTTEATVLVTQMGQVVLVVDAETTTHAALAEALHQLEPCGQVHLVYNKAAVRHAPPDSDGKHP